MKAVLRKLEALRNELEWIDHKINLLLRMEMRMSAEMDALIAKVNEEKVVVDGVVLLLAELSRRLTEAIANSDLPAIRAITLDIERNRQALADAVVANTPAP